MSYGKNISAGLLFLLVFSFFYGCEEDIVSSHNESREMTYLGKYGSSETFEHSFIKNLSGIDYSFLSDGNSGLQILDISNPVSPAHVVGYNVTGYVEETFVWKKDSIPYVFIAAGLGGISIIDVIDINGAVMDTVINFPGDYIRTVYVDTTHKIMYAGGDKKKVYLYDISNLPSVMSISTYQTFSIVNEILVRNNVAYVAQDQGLDIVDVSNPHTPGRLSQGISENYAYDIKLSGNYAYVANDINGVSIFNISNPSNPSEIGFIDTYDNVLGCAIDGDILYVAEDESGVEAYDISNPSNPLLLAYFNTSGNAIGLTVYRGLLFVADNIEYVILRYP